MTSSRSSAGRTIRVGVAGWDYPDWSGVVYPARTGKGFDRLAYLARFVDVVEINSTFYRPVEPRVASSWVRRTETVQGFSFTAKVHRSWTHGPESDLDQAVTPTLSGLQPLLEADRLGALLLQFPQSFHFEPASLERIEHLLPHVEDWPVVVEVRHKSWQAERAQNWFADRGVGWCAVDQPRLASTTRALPRVSGKVGYLRLHGRNQADWFRPDAGRDARYDYLYPSAELESLAEMARRMARTAESLFVIQNNHFRGKALVNALQMARLLHDRTPTAPEELVAVYPDLEPQVHVERHRLF